MCSIRGAISVVPLAASLVLGCSGDPSGPPVQPAFVSVSSGWAHTCGVAPDGAAYCWGDNSSGQLGDGTTTASTTPVLVSGGLNFASIHAGYLHTCGLTTGGSAYCWGDNFFGELGDGTTTNRSTPVPVSGELTFESIHASYFHVCGVTADGSAYCWGGNSDGALGNGTTTNGPTPDPGPVSGVLTFELISAGSFHTCAVATGGSAYCWGLRSAGRLGDGGATTGDQTTPVPVSGELEFESVSAAFAHSCGVTTSGSVYCWGSSGAGRLGNGVTAGSENEPVPVSSVLVFASVSAGHAHTCGVTAGGSAYCWGFNGDGQLGDGTTTDRSTPVAVADGLTFASISAQSGHTCGVTTTGDAYCWGDNSAGQLGDGTTTGRLTPVRVAR